MLQSTTLQWLRARGVCALQSSSSACSDHYTCTQIQLYTCTEHTRKHVSSQSVRGTIVKASQLALSGTKIIVNWLQDMISVYMHVCAMRACHSCHVVTVRMCMGVCARVCHRYLLEGCSLCCDSCEASPQSLNQIEGNRSESHLKGESWILILKSTFVLAWG